MPGDEAKQLDYAPLQRDPWNWRNSAPEKSPNLSVNQTQLTSMRENARGRPGLLSGGPRSVHVFQDVPKMQRDPWSSLV